jgi:methylmalonyl-CoA epimerase
MERVVAGLQQRRVVSEKEKRILAYHEAGHALMSHLMGDALPVHKVTIVSRGQALGYTLNLPAEDRYLHTKEELVDMMKVYLAGRAAEQVVFGRVTNGAANDLERATDLARAMVFDYGMSSIVASRTMRADNYALSEETKRLRDGEQGASPTMPTGGCAAARQEPPGPRSHRSGAPRARTLVHDQLVELLEGVPSSRTARNHRHRARAARRRRVAAALASSGCPSGDSPHRVAVADLDEAVATYEGVFGAHVEARETIASQGAEAVAVTVGDSRIELLAATGEDTPVGRFLAKRGPGMHHVAYEVDDIDAELSRLAGAGVELVDTEPRAGLYGLQVAVLHPQAVHGVLSELVCRD